MSSRQIIVIFVFALCMSQALTRSKHQVVKSEKDESNYEVRFKRQHNIGINNCFKQEEEDEHANDDDRYRSYEDVIDSSEVNDKIRTKSRKRNRPSTDVANPKTGNDKRFVRKSSRGSGKCKSKVKLVPCMMRPKPQPPCHRQTVIVDRPVYVPAPRPAFIPPPAPVFVPVVRPLFRFGLGLDFFDGDGEDDEGDESDENDDSDDDEYDSDEADDSDEKDIHFNFGNSNRASGSRLKYCDEYRGFNDISHESFDDDDDDDEDNSDDYEDEY
jgi:hypothetical protein